MGPYRAPRAVTLSIRQSRFVFAAAYPVLLLSIFMLVLVSTTTATTVAQESIAQPNVPSATEPASKATDTEAGVDTLGQAPHSKINFDPHIRDILIAHCLECHGPKQAKAEMRVDERETLLSYIAPGDLASSSLWSDYLATDDPETLMPPAKHGNPLSALELAAIRVWIEDGAVWPEAIPLTLAQTPSVAASAVVPAAPIKTNDRNIVLRAMTFMGFFHPAIVHFPIGLLLVSCLFVMLTFVNRQAFESAAFHCLWIGALGAIASSVAGWAFADIRGYGDAWHTTWSGDAIARHRICGILLSLLAVAVTGVAYLAKQRSTSGLRFVWLAGAVCLAALVGIVGHQGGELTYGEELFAKAFEQSFGK